MSVSRRVLSTLCAGFQSGKCDQKGQVHLAERLFPLLIPKNHTSARNRPWPRWWSSLEGRGRRKNRGLSYGAESFEHDFFVSAFFLFFFFFRHTQEICLFAGVGFSFFVIEGFFEDIERRREGADVSSRVNLFGSDAKKDNWKRESKLGYLKASRSENWYEQISSRTALN